MTDGGWERDPGLSGSPSTGHINQVKRQVQYGTMQPSGGYYHTSAEFG